MHRDVPVHVRLGGYQGPGSVHTAGLACFGETLEHLTGNNVAVSRTDDVTAEGATARSLFAAIESGSVEAGYIASGYLTDRVPALAVMDLPFSVSDRHSTYAALDADAGELLREAVESATGYKVLGFWDNGFRHLTNAVRPIRSVDDCRGLVIRTLDNDIYRDTMAAMSFVPIVTDVRDLREAIATGQVDAQENPLTNAVIFELYRYHKHLSLTGHLFGLAMFVCNADWFATLTSKMKAMVTRVGEAATRTQREFAEANDTASLRFLRESGVSIVPKDEIDLNSFRQACAAIVARESVKLEDKLIDAYFGVVCLLNSLIQHIAESSGARCSHKARTVLRSAQFSPDQAPHQGCRCPPHCRASPSETRMPPRERPSRTTTRSLRAY